MLGLPDATPWIDVPSPFRSEQLSVRVPTRISTRYRHREHSLDAVADLIACQFEAQPGNYLAFFSSFDYLQQVSDRVGASHPAIPLWLQSRAMDEAAREQFLARFDAAGRGIGFAVLGGAFAEGIDRNRGDDCVLRGEPGKLIIPEAEHLILLYRAAKTKPSLVPVVGWCFGAACEWRGCEGG